MRPIKTSETQLHLLGLSGFLEIWIYYVEAWLKLRRGFLLQMGHALTCLPQFPLLPNMCDLEATVSC